MVTAAAPVSYPVADGGFWHAVRLLWLAASVACLVGWLAWHLGRMAAEQAGLALASAIAVIGLERLRRARRPLPPGLLLQWTGEQWQLGDPGPQAWQVQVGLDLGPWLLLKATAASPRATRWLPLSAQAAPEAWPGLRQALILAPGRAGPLPTGAAP